LSDDTIPTNKKPIILCRTAIEKNATLCLFLQTYYSRGDYCTIDCICLQEKNPQIAQNKYFNNILTEELSRTEYNPIMNFNRYIIEYGYINEITNDFCVNIHQKQFFQYDLSDIINFILFPTVDPNSPAKIYIYQCLQVMANNTEKEYYQKIFNLYRNSTFTKSLFYFDHRDPNRNDYVENILSQFDSPINREVIFAGKNNYI